MTVIAIVAAGDVRRVLAGGSDAIMAGATGPQNLGVIDYHHGREHIGAVAVFTDIGRQRVCRVFARRIRAIMAVDTVTRNRSVVEERR